MFFVVFASMMTSGFLALAIATFVVRDPQTRRRAYRVGFVFAVGVCMAGGLSGFIFFGVPVIMLAFLACRPLRTLA